MSRQNTSINSTEACSIAAVTTHYHTEAEASGMQAYNGGFWGTMQKKNHDDDSTSDDSSSYSSEDSSDPESGDLPNSSEKGIFKYFRIFSMSKTRCLLLTLLTVLLLCAIGTAVVFVVKPKCLGFSKKQKDVSSSNNASGSSNDHQNQIKNQENSSNEDVAQVQKQDQDGIPKADLSPEDEKKNQTVHNFKRLDWKSRYICPFYNNWEDIGTALQKKTKVLVIELDTAVKGTTLHDTMVKFDQHEELLLKLANNGTKIVLHNSVQHLPTDREQHFKDMKLPFEVTLIGAEPTDKMSTLAKASVDQISTKIVIPATKEQSPEFGPATKEQSPWWKNLSPI